MNSKKQELVSIEGINLSSKLFPAEDLFMFSPTALYTELDLVDELEVFGMSPYGDDSLSI